MDGIDEHEKIVDTESEVFMEICGNEDWMPRYEDTVWPSKGSTMVTACVDEIRDNIDAAERVKINYNGMSQRNQQRADGIQQYTAT